MRSGRVLVAVALVCVSAPPSAPCSVGTLVTVELVERRELFARYNEWLDSDGAERRASTFTSGDVFGTNVDPDATMKFGNSFHADCGGHARQWNTNLMILASAESVSARVSLSLEGVATEPRSIVTSTTCLGELVETERNGDLGNGCRSATWCEHYFESHAACDAWRRGL